jgi:ATP-dependent Lhr-like helicase
LQGAAIPASVLERDVLPARVDGYRPAMLDELCAAGELVWIGAGPLGDDDGRVRLCFRDRVRLLVPPASTNDPPSAPLHEAIRERLRAAGASFWPELLAAAGNPDQQALLDALWDLVWAGEVTNDTFGPLRVPRRAKKRSAASARRPPLSRLSRLGPPAAAGRWSLVAPLLEPRPSATEAAHALALQLLERHGVVTREGVKSEGVAGGYAAVYPVLRALEESGRIRRGWFVATLGAAQFALGGAVERLRSERRPQDETHALVLGATDPAQPYGAAIAWPESRGRPARAAGAYAVLVDGELAAYLERGGRGLLTFAREPGDDGAPPDPAVWIEAIVRAAKEGRVGALQLQRIDDGPARQSPLAPALRAAGFVDGYRGLTLRA